MNPDTNAVEEASAEAFLSPLRTIAAPERRKHASVYNYWLTIRANREFPPIHDLDPLELSDAGPFSILLEMIGGGEDAEIRHVGQAIRGGIDVEKICEAPNPSILSCIAARLPVVAACRDAFAFEDEFESANGKTRCWVTLLPFSATGTWIDFVYGFVTLDPAPGIDASDDAEEAEEAAEAEDVEAIVEAAPEPVEETSGPEPMEEAASAEPECEPEPEGAPQAATSAGKAGFSAKFFESLASVKGFYGRPVEMDLEVVPEEAGEPLSAEEAREPMSHDEPSEPAAIDEADEPVVEGQPSETISTAEGPLQSRLTEVRAKADEARQAKLRANAALYEGLSAAYDFALDAEDSPEEYLRLVEAEGLKIQLRSPMKPVAKLAFDGMCDDSTIKQLEAILAWAFDQELPRGSLAEQIEAAGGIAAILSGQAKAA